RRAIELAPNSPEAWICRSQVALAGRDNDAARHAAETALRLDPQNSAARNNLGVALLRSGQRAKASAAFVDAGRLNPNSKAVQHNLVLSGMFVPRIVLILALLPLLFVPGVGTTLFLVLAVGVNVLLFRVPWIKRWAQVRGLRAGESSVEAWSFSD